VNAPPEVKPRRWKKVFWVLLGLLALEQLLPPDRQPTALALVAGIDLYQATLSKWMPTAGVRCRFTPTCSHYAEGAIEKSGSVVGSLRAGWRLLRCGPWSQAGTVDPP
jgi:uncharacterized protein